MTVPLRIGFAGVGAMGQMAHLRNYVHRDDCQVAAIAELRAHTGAAVARRYGIRSVYPSAAAMLEGEELDALVASQPFSRHGILVPELLQAGIPIFTEKPLAGSVAVAQRIADAVAESGTFLMVGYHKRSDPATAYAKDVVDRWRASGEMGPLKYIRILMPAGDWIANGFRDLIQKADDPVPLEWDPPADDMDAETFQVYTEFVNYYIHQVNLMHHFLGESYRPVYADPTRVLLVAESASGVPVTIEMSPYTTSVDWQEEALICFEKGWVKLALPAPLARTRPGAVRVYRDPRDGTTPEETSPTLPREHAMGCQAGNFLAAVRGETPPMTSAAEALDDLLVAREYVRLLTGQ